jgi:hypothetical protein
MIGWSWTKNLGGYAVFSFGMYEISTLGCLLFVMEAYDGREREDKGAVGAG